MAPRGSKKSKDGGGDNGFMAMDPDAAWPAGGDEEYFIIRYPKDVRRARAKNINN